jgi:alcohol dehydrogenase (NADP+)
VTRPEKALADNPAHTGSDIHTLRSGWGQTDYPQCVGHEITGTAVRVGSKVKHVQVGDRVGVGAQASACLKPDCYDCSSGDVCYVRLSRRPVYSSQTPQANS